MIDVTVNLYLIEANSTALGKDKTKVRTVAEHSYFTSMLPLFGGNKRHKKMWRHTGKSNGTVVL